MANAMDRSKELEKQREKFIQDRLSFEKLKEELLNYKFGNKLTKELDAEGLDYSDMNRVRVAVFGTPGSGRTSFIGTVERTLLGKERQTAFGMGLGCEETIILEEYLPSLKINLLDTRCLFSIDENTWVECQNIMTGKLRVGEIDVKDEDSVRDVATRNMAKFSDRVHALVFVFQANDIRLKQGSFHTSRGLKKIRDYFRFEGHIPITVITHDQLCTYENDRELVLRNASAATGSPIDKTFFISNYTYDNIQYSLETELKALKIMDALLLSAEEYVKFQKLSERRRLQCEKLKGELLNYKFGNKLTTKAFDEEGLDYSDMNRVLVALFGPTGSGKSCFIGTVERTLLGKERQTVFEQGAGSEGTVILQEYLPSLKINVLDTRGFWNIDDNTLEECLNVMTGRTREGDVDVRNEDDEQIKMEVETARGNLASRRMPKFSDRVHAVVFVVQAKDKRLKDGIYLKRMKKIRDHFRFEGHSPITVITCEDELRSENDRELAFREASAATGSPIDRTFFIGNYTKDNNEYSLDTEMKAVNIMDTVLLSAERFVKIQKLREKHHGKDFLAGTAIQEFFKQNQAVYKWNPERVASIVKQLDDLGIATVESLKESWNHVKAEVKMTIGIRTGLEQALMKI